MMDEDQNERDDLSRRLDAYEGLLAGHTLALEHLLSAILVELRERGVLIEKFLVKPASLPQYPYLFFGDDTIARETFDGVFQRLARLVNPDGNGDAHSSLPKGNSE